jgi:hypothetical protein
VVKPCEILLSVPIALTVLGFEVSGIMSTSFFYGA